MIWRRLINNTGLHYTVLGLAVMLPLLLPGYILTLDLVFAPRLAWPAELSNSYLFEAALHILNLVMPSQAIEKVLLLAILVLSGVGAHKLVLAAVNIDKKYLYWGAYFAGMFYMINPFVYSRFIAGQHLVLLGYALTPFFVMALINLIKSPSWRSALIAAAWASVVVGVSLHHAGILLVVAAALVLAMVWSYRRQLTHLKKLAVCLAISVGALLLANAYWLVPTALGGNSISQATGSFGAAEYEAFATNGEGALGALGNVLRLQGFWADARGMYILPQQQVPAWGLIMLAIWALVAIGAVKLWHKNRSLAAGLGMSAVAAVVLATTPLIVWLAGSVPFAAGYREPQKFIAILALVFVVLAGAGVAALLQRLAKKYSASIVTAALCGVLVLPIICTPTMLWGLNGQLQPREYPADWYTLNDMLNNDASATKVLFLPWHQYIDFSLSGRIIANPAAKFFNKQTVAGDNPEYKNIQPTVPNSANRRVEQEILAVGGQTTKLGSNLSNLGFSHVILAKEYDYQDYGYLDSQTDLKLVSDTETLKLYAVMKGGQ